VVKGKSGRPKEACVIEHRIPAKGYASFHVERGDRFAVIDPEGEQIADLIAFNAEDHAEKLSTEYTLTPGRAGRVRLSTGDSLYTQRGRPILTITADTCGVHDMLFPPCASWIVEQRHGQSGEPGCRENLTRAVEPEGLGERDLPSTFNVFMKTTVTDQEYIDIRVPESEPGDRVEFRADEDAFVAISACPSEGKANGRNPTPLDLELPDGTTVHGA
jgi:hypothetical protein